MTDINISELASRVVEDLQAVRASSPLVHSITNYVVMNNTANALLSIGASPVMAQAVEEVEDMAGIASAVVLNIGTLSREWVVAMEMAGKTATKRGIPLVFDPVGAGATAYRTQTCIDLILSCKPSIIRGNGSEVMAVERALCEAEDNIDAPSTKGVDSSAASSDAVAAALRLSRKTDAIVSISGATDYITDGTSILEVHNGAEIMTRVTGLGCTATALTGAFAAVDHSSLYASYAAMAVMGVAGEMAAEHSSGNGSMQMNFLDTLCGLAADDIRSRLR